MAAALKVPSLLDDLAKIQFEPVTMTSKEMAAPFAEELKRWSAVLKAANLGKQAEGKQELPA
jgi:hypothetical protein